MSPAKQLAHNLSNLHDNAVEREGSRQRKDLPQECDAVTEVAKLRTIQSRDCGLFQPLDTLIVRTATSRASTHAVRSTGMSRARAPSSRLSTKSRRAMFLGSLKSDPDSDPCASLKNGKKKRLFQDQGQATKAAWWLLGVMLRSKCRRAVL